MPRNASSVVVMNFVHVQRRKCAQLGSATTSLGVLRREAELVLSGREGKNLREILHFVQNDITGEPYGHFRSRTKSVSKPAPSQVQGERSGKAVDAGGEPAGVFYIPTAPSARTLRIPPCFWMVPSTINRKRLRSTL
jgi:hypothetical protein